MQKSIITAAGPLAIPITNDYLFRALLQQNNNVLKGLISSLLHLSLKEIISVEITNPIELGTAIDSKTFLLDIKLLLNNNTIINLEMQVIKKLNNTNRKLNSTNRKLTAENRQLSAANKKKDGQIEHLTAELEKLRAEQAK